MLGKELQFSLRNIDFRSNVQDKISGGSAQITGNFTLDEAQNLARDLNTGAIPPNSIVRSVYNQRNPW